MRGKLIPQMRAMTKRPSSAEAHAGGGVAGASLWPLSFSGTTRNFHYPPCFPGDHTRNL